ncbi:hypothetical protein [Haloplanus natans]|uniref:hypothetical protein n=1 Tax=Haloplanus natans TaxID=376171 RepID=UPI0012F7D0FC|nr:hypothetical protein [Haloplanus natans]
MKESDLKPLCKDRVEQVMESEGLRVVQWYEEASIQAASRSVEVPPAFVHERVDLLCVSQRTNQQPIISVIEVKDKFNKKAIGQALVYEWALRNASEIKVSGDTISLPDSFQTHCAICCRAAKSHYRQFIEDVNSDILRDEARIDLYNVSQ